MVFECRIPYLQLRLDFPRLLARQYLDMTRHLLPCPCFPSPYFDISCNELIPAYKSLQSSHHRLDKKRYIVLQKKVPWVSKQIWQ